MTVDLDISGTRSDYLEDEDIVPSDINPRNTTCEEET